MNVGLVLANALTLACIYGTLAIGLSVTWSSLGLVNMAYGFIFALSGSLLGKVASIDYRSRGGNAALLPAQPARPVVPAGGRRGCAHAARARSRPIASC